MGAARLGLEEPASNREATGVADRARWRAMAATWSPCWAAASGIAGGRLHPVNRDRLHTVNTSPTARWAQAWLQSNKINSGNSGCPSWTAQAAPHMRRHGAAVSTETRAGCRAGRNDSDEYMKKITREQR